jgi:hypothetical protein
MSSFHNVQTRSLSKRKSISTTLGAKWDVCKSVRIWGARVLLQVSDSEESDPASSPLRLMAEAEGLAEMDTDDMDAEHSQEPGPHEETGLGEQEYAAPEAVAHPLDGLSPTSPDPSPKRKALQESLGVFIILRILCLCLLAIAMTSSPQETLGAHCLSCKP